MRSKWFVCYWFCIRLCLTTPASLTVQALIIQCIRRRERKRRRKNSIRNNHVWCFVRIKIASIFVMLIRIVLLWIIIHNGQRYTHNNSTQCIRLQMNWINKCAAWSVYYLHKPCLSFLSLARFVQSIRNIVPLIALVKCINRFQMRFHL